MEDCRNLSATEVLNLLIRNGEMLEEEREFVCSVKVYDDMSNNRNAFYRVVSDPYQDRERYVFDTVRVWYNDDGVMQADRKG